jgi:hypothetical protein
VQVAVMLRVARLITTIRRAVSVSSLAAGLTVSVPGV